jgi:hypothetical protein
MEILLVLFVAFFLVMGILWALLMPRSKMTPLLIFLPLIGVTLLVALVCIVPIKISQYRNNAKSPLVGEWKVIVEGSARKWSITRTGQILGSLNGQAQTVLGEMNATPGASADIDIEWSGSAERVPFRMLPVAGGWRLVSLGPDKESFELIRIGKRG